MILHVKKTERFTVLANDLLRNQNLSWEARGLLSYILSFPDGWKLNVSHLVKSGGIVEPSTEGEKQKYRAGKEKVYRILNELKASGYISGAPKRGTGGNFSGYDYVVYEEPVDKSDNVDNLGDIPSETCENSPQPAFPDAAAPDAGDADAYKRLIYNKDYTSPSSDKPKVKKGKADGVVNDIHTLFAAFGSDYRKDGREGKACAEMKEMYLADPKEFAQMALTLRGMRNTDKFYAAKPFAPSTLNTFWNTIKVKREADRPRTEKPAPEAFDDAAFLTGIKKEMDDAGWPYDGSLDSLVKEAYSDMLHAEAKKSAGVLK